MTTNTLAPTNPTVDPTKSQRTFLVTYSDGQTLSVGVDDLKACVMGAYIDKATVGIEESRSRRQYEQAKKSMFLTADFSACWDLIKGMEDPQDKKEARAIVLERIKHFIMGMEEMAFNMVMHSLLKDGLQADMRDKENPYVQHGSDLKAGLEAARLKGRSIGG